MQILSDAAHNADGIGVFETTDRHWKSVVATPLMMPAAALASACLLRPWHVKHLVFGGILPVVPWTLISDGVVSNLRTYRARELQTMVSSIEAPNFRWKIGSVPLLFAGGPRANYLLGWRTRAT